jgi:hypothetical protein
VPWGLLADFVVCLHLAYVAFVIVGEALILVGWWRGWAYVRNPWFRLVHFACIALVAAEALLDVVCPLTTLEDELRRRGGESVDQASFVGRLASRLLFYEAPPSVFTACYVAFGLLVLLTLVACPPRWRRG